MNVTYTRFGSTYSLRTRAVAGGHTVGVEKDGHKLGEYEFGVFDTAREAVRQAAVDLGLIADPSVEGEAGTTKELETSPWYLPFKEDLRDHVLLDPTGMIPAPEPAEYDPWANMPSMALNDVLSMRGAPAEVENAGTAPFKKSRNNLAFSVRLNELALIPGMVPSSGPWDEIAERELTGDPLLDFLNEWRAENGNPTVTYTQSFGKTEIEFEDEDQVAAFSDAVGRRFPDPLHGVTPLGRRVERNEPVSNKRWDYYIGNRLNNGNVWAK